VVTHGIESHSGSRSKFEQDFTRLQHLGRRAPKARAFYKPGVPS
jgi:hypothetical protein